MLFSVSWCQPLFFEWRILKGCEGSSIKYLFFTASQDRSKGLTLVMDQKRFRPKLWPKFWFRFRLCIPNPKACMHYKASISNQFWVKAHKIWQGIVRGQGPAKQTLIGSGAHKLAIIELWAHEYNTTGLGRISYRVRTLYQQNQLENIALRSCFAYNIL